MWTYCGHVAPQAPARARARGRVLRVRRRSPPRRRRSPLRRGPEDAGDPGRRPFRLGETLPVLLVKAAHPRQALVTALGMAVAAGIAGRPLREIGLVFVTVLVGQAMLGWDNDLVDRGRDERHELPDKPIASGLLEPGHGVVQPGLRAAPRRAPRPQRRVVGPAAPTSSPCSIGLLGNRVLRGSVLSFLPWVLQFGLYPAYLAYGGWNGTGTRHAAHRGDDRARRHCSGLGVHVLRALPGLVPDNQDGLRSLPLRIALQDRRPPAAGALGGLHGGDCRAPTHRRTGDRSDLSRR